MRNYMLIKLKEDYKIDVFRRIKERFGKVSIAAKKLKINHITLRSYKNGSATRIPLVLINKLIKLRIISKKEFEENIESKIRNDELRGNILDKGRKIRQKRLIEFKENMPSIKEIVHPKFIDFLTWFEKYKFLLESGFRKLKVDYKTDYIVVSYPNFNRKEIKNFEVKLPKRIKLDENFMYFFGLWVGDKCGGKRFGVSNKQEDLLEFSEKYLKLLKQNTRRDLYIGMKEKLPKNAIYDNIVRIRKRDNGYVIALYSFNGIFASFFNFLEANLDIILRNKFRDNFFAGLFDAEGNVSWEDKCFRWACKNEELLKIYIKHLKEKKMFRRYDGANIVTYNKEEFSKSILPYLKHSKKINKSKLLCYGKGDLDERFKNILKKVKDNEGITTKDLAKALKRVKVYSQINFLEDFGYIRRENYPLKNYITMKGLNELNRGQGEQ